MTTPRIQSVACELPDHRATQDQLVAALRAMWERDGHDVERLEAFHRSAKVEARHLAMPLEAYLTASSFTERNEAWICTALDLGERAIRNALRQAGVEPEEVDHLFFVTVTGLATPSIDARLVNRLGLRSDVRRTPIFGLGCVAGAAGLARMADYLRAFPTHTAVLLSVELCSLTIQHADVSITNLIASGLFGDGAAAVVMRGAEVARSPGPEVLASESVFYPDTEHVMGWQFVDSGFKVVLSPDVPRLVTENVRGNVERFLDGRGLDRSGIRHWIAHTGGPRVLEAFESELQLRDGELRRSWDSLRSVGNLSSASVLFVLSDLLGSGDAGGGEHGLLMAMGPGFCAELVLLRW